MATNYTNIYIVPINIVFILKLGDKEKKTGSAHKHLGSPT